MNDKLAMPTQRCRRSLATDMSKILQSQMENSPQTRRKRLRSLDGELCRTPQAKNRRLGGHVQQQEHCSLSEILKSETPRKSPRIAQCRIEGKNNVMSTTTRGIKTKGKDELFPTKKATICKAVSVSKIIEIIQVNNKSIASAVRNNTVSRQKSPCSKSNVNNSVLGKENSDSTENDISNNSSSDEHSLPTRSFYGSKTFVSPIERKTLIGKQSENKSENWEFRSPPLSSKTKSSVVSMKKVQHNKIKTKTKERKKKTANKVTLCSSLKGKQKTKKDIYKRYSTSKLQKIMDLSSDSNSNNLVGGNKMPKKRFFSNRSPGKQMKITLAKLGITKSKFGSSVKETDDKKMFAQWSKKRKELKMNQTDTDENKQFQFETNSQFDENVKIQMKSPNDFCENSCAISTDNNHRNSSDGPESEISGRVSAMSTNSDNFSTFSTASDLINLLPEGFSENYFPDNCDKKHTLNIEVSNYKKDSLAVIGNDTNSVTRPLINDSTVGKPCYRVDDNENIFYNQSSNSSNDKLSEPSSSNKDVDCIQQSDLFTADNIGSVLLMTQANKCTSNNDDIVNNKDTSFAVTPKKIKIESTSTVDEDDCKSTTPNEKADLMDELKKKRLFSIFEPAAQSSPKSSINTSCPSTPSSQFSVSSNSPYSIETKPSPAQTWKKFKDKGGKEQMTLDFGQKLQITEPCPVCGVTYTRGESNDETTHQKVHQRILNVLKFSGWKKERVLQELIDGGRIIMILPDEKQCMKKVAAVKAIVDEELGFVVERSVTVRPNSKVFLFISSVKRIVGFCIAEVITKGYKVLSEEEVQSIISQSPTKRKRPNCCSTVPVHAKCGINRIWVLGGERKKNIATTLVDCVRYNFLLGSVIPHHQLAFSDPTPDGHRFAARYTKTPNFLVYNKQS